MPDVEKLKLHARLIKGASENSYVKLSGVLSAIFSAGILSIIAWLVVDAVDSRDAVVERISEVMSGISTTINLIDKSMRVIVVKQENLEEQSNTLRAGQVRQWGRINDLEKGLALINGRTDNWHRPGYD